MAFPIPIRRYLGIESPLWRSCQSFWMSSDHEKVVISHDSQENWREVRSEIVVSIVPADGQASSARTSAGTMMKKAGSHIYSVSTTVLNGLSQYGYFSRIFSTMKHKAISIAQCKTAVSLLLTYWKYCSLALSHLSAVTQKQVELAGSLIGLWQ